MEIKDKVGLTVSEAAELLGLSVRNVYTLTHRADFPAVRVGRKILVLRGRLEAWLAEHAGENLTA